MNTSEIETDKPKLFNNGFEKYPITTVLLENSLMLIWILTGAYLCALISPTVGWVYLAFGLSMVLVIMRILVCRNCYYYSKRCHTGWGKLSAMYCKPGNISRFGCGAAGAVIPIFYSSMALIPLILGIISFVKSFTSIALIILLVSSQA
jgi:hypothetical protein